MAITDAIIKDPSSPGGRSRFRPRNNWRKANGSCLVLSFLFVIGGFVGMEFLSWFFHRFLFHGPFWAWHRSHREPSRGFFEKNDLFSLGFALVSLFFWFSSNPMVRLWALSMTLYGLLYFLVHDLVIHRRLSFPVQVPTWLRKVVRGHRHHHRSRDQKGQGPFGLWSGL
ncbi:MAG: sterol desaturase family protein [Bdellovibrionales bacterium]